MGCMVTVDPTSSTRDESATRSLWRAAVAIDAMYVRERKTGWATELGA